MQLFTPDVLFIISWKHLYCIYMHIQRLIILREPDWDVGIIALTSLYFGFKLANARQQSWCFTLHITVYQIIVHSWVCHEGDFSFYYVFFSLPELCSPAIHKNTHTHTLPALQMAIGNVPLSKAIKRQLCCKACGERLHPSHMDVSAVRKATTTCINFGFTPSALMATNRWENNYWT